MMDQIPITAMEKIAIFGSDTQFTCTPKTWLIRPKSALNSHLQTIATAAGAATIGRKKMVRYTLLPFIFLFRRTASTREIAIEKGTSTIAYLMVLINACHT